MNDIHIDQHTPHLLKQLFNSEDAKVVLADAKFIVEYIDIYLIGSVALICIFICVYALFSLKYKINFYTTSVHIIKIFSLLFSILLFCLWVLLFIFPEDELAVMYKYLQNIGNTAFVYHNVYDINSSSDIEVILVLDKYITNNELKHLLNIVEQGNHLLINASVIENTSLLGINIEHSDGFSNTKLFLENEDIPAVFAFEDNKHLVDIHNSAYTWANSDNNTHILQIPYHYGLVTTISDNIWINNKISEVDNAWGLWYFTNDAKVVVLTKFNLLSVLDNFQSVILLFACILFLIYVLCVKTYKCNMFFLELYINDVKKIIDYYSYNKQINIDKYLIQFTGFNYVQLQKLIS